MARREVNIFRPALEIRSLGPPVWNPQLELIQGRQSRTKSVPTSNRTLQRPLAGISHSTRHPLHQLASQSTAVQGHGCRQCRCGSWAIIFLVLGDVIVLVHAILQGLMSSARLRECSQTRPEVGCRQERRRVQRRRQMARMLLGSGVVDLAALATVDILGILQVRETGAFRDGLERARRRLAAVKGRGSEVAEGFADGAGVGRDARAGSEEALKLSRCNRRVPSLLAAGRRCLRGR